MFVVCVLQTKDKRHSRDEVQKEIPDGVAGIFY
jgi:hypothetical protein